MLDLVFVNPIFWLNIIATVIVVIVVFIFKKQLNILEAIIQCVVTFLVMFIVYYVGFETNFELHDKEVWNGNITKFAYYEEWTELVHYIEQVYDGKDSNGNSKYHTEYKTRYDYHSPRWEIKTTIGTHDSSKQIFKKAKEKYGSKFINIVHSGQSSIGDGNMYECVPNDIVPISKWNDYINYIRASRFTILKNKGNNSLINQYISSRKLVPYPEFQAGEFGQNYFFRVVNTSGFNKTYIADFEKALSCFCAQYSGPKQFNIVVYITSGVQRSFPSILEEYWKSAHKNDTVLIFNINPDGSLNWSDSISWTKNGTYITEAKNFTYGFDSEKNTKNLYNQITNNVMHNWERVPMKTFEYLKSELQLPTWFQIMIFFINLALNTILMMIFLKNGFNKGDYI